MSEKEQWKAGEAEEGFQKEVALSFWGLPGQDGDGAGDGANRSSGRRTLMDKGREETLAVQLEPSGGRGHGQEAWMDKEGNAGGDVTLE